MKKYLIIVCLSVAFSFSAFAQYFQVQAQCYFNQNNGKCTVVNNYPNILYCSLRAKGRVTNGQFVYANEDVTLYPGSYAYVEVYSNYYPFDRVFGFAQCRF